MLHTIGWHLVLFPLAGSGPVAAPPQETRFLDNEDRASAMAAALQDEGAGAPGDSQAQRPPDLVAEAATLWPAVPQKIPALESWLERARAIPEDELGEHPGLSQLLAEEATTREHGWSVPRRLAFARKQEQGFAEGGEYARSWAEALPAIREAYPGVDLTPRVGLTPLGPDPESGLWEFAHLASGEPAQRTPDGKLVLTEDTGIVLVLLPGGGFWMGAQNDDEEGRNHDPQAQEDEGPVHEVELSPFFLSKYELTQGQWLRLTGRNPSAHPRSEEAPAWLHPVEQVSWLDCTTGLRRADLTLPTEAQWEYAARGGTDTPWWTGAERETLLEKRAANLADRTAAQFGASWVGLRDWPELNDGFARHAPVGTFAANAFGLHDVAGNVWEWCLDGYLASLADRTPEADPVVPAEGLSAGVLRGGSFLFSARFARSANRSFSPPSYADVNIGVRAAMALAP